MKVRSHPPNTVEAGDQYLYAGTAVQQAKQS